MRAAVAGTQGASGCGPWRVLECSLRQITRRYKANRNKIGSATRREKPEADKAGRQAGRGPCRRWPELAPRLPAFSRALLDTCPGDTLRAGEAQHALLLPSVLCGADGCGQRDAPAGRYARSAGWGRPGSMQAVQNRGEGTPFPPPCNVHIRCVCLRMAWTGQRRRGARHAPPSFSGKVPNTSALAPSPLAPVTWREQRQGPWAGDTEGSQMGTRGAKATAGPARRFAVR